MARWNIRRIKKKLKVEPSRLEEGIYINTKMSDDFVVWLRVQKFKESVSDERKERGLVSPDGKWLISFQQTAKDFVFVQLKNKTL